MSVGVLTTKAQLDSLLTSLTHQFKVTISNIKAFNDDVRQTSNAQLAALGYGVNGVDASGNVVAGTIDSPAAGSDIALIRACSDDLENLYGVYLGTSSQTTPYDFTQNIKMVWGVG